MNQTEQQRRRRKIRKRQQQKVAELAEQRKAKANPPDPDQKAINQKAKRKRRRNPGHHVPQVLEVPDFQPSLYNKVCYIIGGGPSLMNFEWKNLDGKFLIAINRAYETLPNAQIVYFTDDDYWQRHQTEMLQHTGKLYRGRIARHKVIKDKEVTEIQLQPKPQGWSDQYGELHHGSNSTYACIQLAAQLGFNKIYLLGVDMKHQGKYNRQKKNNKGVTHWHSGHRRTDPATAYRGFVNHYKQMVPLAKQRGVEIINVNTPEGTSLQCFPIKSFDEVFS